MDVPSGPLHCSIAPSMNCGHSQVTSSRWSPTPRWETNRSSSHLRVKAGIAVSGWFPKNWVVYGWYIYIYNHPIGRKNATYIYHLYPLIAECRWYIITQLAIYTTYIPIIYCQLGDYRLPTTKKKGTRNSHWPGALAVWCSLCVPNWKRARKWGSQNGLIAEIPS